MTPPSARPRAVIVTVGDELLLGETVDTNAAWLGRWLEARGIGVLRRATVGDDDPAIAGAVEETLGSGVELVLVTGGLGPTSDDRTREAVAALLGAPLEVDAELLAALEARFRARGWDRLPQRNVSQAQVPRGATVLANPHGTAPGLALRRGPSLVVLLPGVPREMVGIAEGDLAALLRRELGDALPPVHHRVVHTTGIPESALAEAVDAHLPADMGPVRVAFLRDVRGVDLRLTARGVPAGEAGAWLDRVLEALEPALAPWRFEAASGDLVEALAGALDGRALTLAVGESCTGGLILQRLTERAGSSSYLRGGVVAYANEAKVALLGVAPDALERHGAVSEEVALQMARGAARILDADCGIGITGIAGPGGGSDEKPVGTVWYAARVGEREAARLGRFGGDRSAVRERSAQAALALLLREVEAEPPPGDGARSPGELP